MPSPTVASLTAKLGSSLRPIHPNPALDLAVTGVHVSELVDPTRYLDGGEILLTTGLAVPTEPAAVREYVRRLRAAGISALGFGLGPVHDSVPDELIAACRESGLSLLSVPPPVAFQEISRAYWNELRRDDQRELTDALGAHAELVRAAAGDDPSLSLLRNLADGIDGWAAHLWPDGTPRHVWPLEATERVNAARSEINRLIGGRSSPAAAFGVGDDEVVVQTVPATTPTAGLLAVGSRTRPTATQRSLISMTSLLLGLTVARGFSGRDLVRARGSMLARLVELGEPDAARELARELGFDFPDGAVRVIAIVGPSVLELFDWVESAWNLSGFAIGHVVGNAGWCITGDNERGVEAAVERFRSAPQDVSMLVSGPIHLTRVAKVKVTLLRDAQAVPRGTVGVLGRRPERRGRTGLGLTRTDAMHMLEPLTENARDLVPELVEYLRHRGGWEAAAKALGIHRNTLRHRIARVRELLDRDLDDPDVSAELWFAIRALGLG